MATCPYCLGPLTDGHRCQRRRWWRRLRLLGLPVAGSLLGTTVCYGLIERPHGIVVLAGAVLGGLLADACGRAVSSGV